MKYMMLLTRAAWEDSAPEEQRRKMYGEIMEWWSQLRAEGKIVEGHQLQPPHTATTVVLGGGQVIDGPFIEAKETIGGYGILDVADLDEAISIARSFPSPGGKVEVRPVVQR